jgi:hypothetical protein
MKKTIFYLTTIFVTLFLIFISAEIILRISGHRSERARKKWTFDNRLGHVDKNDWHRVLYKEHSGPFIELRNQKVYFKKPKEIKRRIIFVGDSGTYGVHVGQEDVFPEVFKRLLPKEIQPQIEVINTGVVGFTTVQEYHFLKDKLLQFKPDIVVLNIFMANDINFNGNHRKLLIDKNPTQYWLTSIRTYSAFINYLYYEYLNLTQAPYDTPKYSKEKVEENFDESMDLFKEDKFRFNPADFVFGEIALYLKEQPTSIKKAYEVTEEILLRMKELSEIYKFQFIISLVPTASTLGNKLNIPVERLHLNRPLIEVLKERGVDPVNDLDFMQTTNNVLAICKRLEVTCINPLYRMREGAGVNAINVHLEDDHPSLIGNKLYAEELRSHFNVKELYFEENK